FMDAYERYVQAKAKMSQRFAEFQEVMIEAEEIGDGSVEVLEEDPEALYSWGGGLSEKWAAADGTMEAQIHFLGVTYHFQRFVNSGGHKDELDLINESLSELTEKINSITNLKLFQNSAIPRGDQVGQYYAAALPGLLDNMKQSVAGSVAAYQSYLTQLQTYSAASDTLLETIEVTEESADSKVEGQSEAIERTQTIVYTLMTLSSVAGLAIGIFAAVVFRKQVVEPLEQITSNMELAANGEAIDASQLSASEDEIGAMSRALDVFIRLFEENRRVSTESFRNSRALKEVSTPIFMADESNNIIFENNAALSLLEQRASEIQAQGLPMNRESLMGRDIDIFAQGAAYHQHLEQQESRRSDDITLGALCFHTETTPILEDGKRIGVVVEIIDKTEQEAARAKEREEFLRNTRIKQALDNVSSGVMMADANRDIIYMNQAVVNVLSEAEEDIRKDLPAFSVQGLLGKSIDQFHKNPAHQKGILDKLTGNHTAQIEVGGRHMYLTINPVFEGQERLGTVVEWQDVSADVMTEGEVRQIVGAASQGDFSQRIVEQGKTGFYANLASGINAVLSSSENFVQDVARVFSAMSEGNLRERITDDYSGAFQEIKENANRTIDKLADIARKIGTASSAVHTAAEEIRQGNSDLSVRTEQQASSLEETSSSMEEMTATINGTAQSASSAVKQSNQAREKAQAGGAVVQQAVGAMSEILTASRKINEIIGVIDEIAFQTNLLALNAAVEAARAGDQGRGFAVVAGEVRSLSQRSAAAAREIKDLIKDSVAKVESGSDLVNQSGETLQEIVRAVETVGRMITEINVSATEQASGISQINQAVSHMDDMTQQNAALVEEATAASAAMAEQASTMSALVSFFKAENS
ncbi:MAG: methyl-accepting chemotaxis protein, partial [Pseudomonadales bacterium]|nr:methyl-accepting chemotaxis protein [Pseudomonadales bacterium]